MTSFTPTTERVYRMASALRSRYAELRPLTVDNNLSEALDDLSGQHGRHAAELAELANRHAGHTGGAVTDGVAGDEHPIPPSLPLGLSPSIAAILNGALRAETDLRRAYDRAIAAERSDSPLLSALKRQAVAVDTILSRLDAMSAYS